MKTPPHFELSSWSYQRFADARVLPLIALYVMQLLVLVGVYIAIPAFRRSTLAIVVTSVVLALMGATRGLFGPVRSASERSTKAIDATPHSDGVTEPMEGIGATLVRLTGLDVYGRSLLSRRVAAYLSSAALLLLVTSLLQLLTFAYLAYQPLIDIAAPSAAAVLSLLFAVFLTTTLAISERALLTTELTWRVSLMYALHLVLAGAIAAIMTTAMMLRIADSIIVRQVITNRVQARLGAEVLRLGKPAASLNSQEIAHLRAIAAAVEAAPQRPTFIEKVQALHDIRDVKSDPASQNPVELRATLTKTGLIRPPLVAGSLLRTLQWSLFALFWLLPSTNMVARLLAPREVNFYFSLTKQVRYTGYELHEAVAAEDAQNSAIPVTVSAA